MDKTGAQVCPARRSFHIVTRSTCFPRGVTREGNARYMTAPASKELNDSTGRMIATFVIVVLAASVGNLTQTGLNAMMLNVCESLGITSSVGQWLTTSYMLVIGLVVPLSSYLLGRFRFKSLILFAIMVFIGGSLLAVFAPTFQVLLAARIIQAVASGVLMPLIQTIAMANFPAGRRATAMGVAGIALGFAPNIGPTIGGAMVGVWGWRSFFVLTGSIMLVLALLGAIIIRNNSKMPSTGLDAVSFVYSAVGFGGLLLGATEASSEVLTDVRVWLPVLVGIAFIVLFVRRQKRVDDPLVDLSIFASRRYTIGFVASVLLFASFMGITLLLPMFIEEVQGGSSLTGGMALLPGTIAALIVNPLSGYLTDRVGARRVTLVSGACLFIGAASFLFTSDTTPLWVLMLMQGVRSCGVSGLISPLTSWGLSELSGKQLADGSAFVTLGRQCAASIGTALLMMCLQPAALIGIVAYHVAFGLSALFALGSWVTIIARVRN